MTPEERAARYVPRVCIFGGKAFATYVQAKRIVKFITDVAATVNNDPDIGDLLKVHLTSELIDFKITQLLVTKRKHNFYNHQFYKFIILVNM